MSCLASSDHPGPMRRPEASKMLKTGCHLTSWSAVQISHDKPILVIQPSELLISSNFPRKDHLLTSGSGESDNVNLRDGTGTFVAVTAPNWYGFVMVCLETSKFHQGTWVEHEDQPRAFGVPYFQKVFKSSQDKTVLVEMTTTLLKLEQLNRRGAITSLWNSTRPWKPRHSCWGTCGGREIRNWQEENWTVGIYRWRVMTSE